jgi:hypothetical protein
MPVIEVSLSLPLRPHLPLPSPNLKHQTQLETEPPNLPIPHVHPGRRIGGTICSLSNDIHVYLDSLLNYQKFID